MSTYYVPGPEPSTSQDVRHSVLGREKERQQMAGAWQEHGRSARWRVLRQEYLLYLGRKTELEPFEDMKGVFRRGESKLVLL